jgi:hypothetical protein
VCPACHIGATAVVRPIEQVAYSPGRGREIARPGYPREVTFARRAAVVVLVCIVVGLVLGGALVILGHVGPI